MSIFNNQHDKSAIERLQLMKQNLPLAPESALLPAQEVTKLGTFKQIIVMAEIHFFHCANIPFSFATLIKGLKLLLDYVQRQSIHFHP